ncbi:hypothetical protein Kisp02_35140 [Kineosporia sp. NBRC 101731]|nr:hypothetical protein Kisp02_35140 [Kineosporia sp. NBRC 101731]
MVRMSKSPTIAASTCLRYEVFRFDPMGTGMPIVAIASLLPFHSGHPGEFVPIYAPRKSLPDRVFQMTTQVRRPHPERREKIARPEQSQERHRRLPEKSQPIRGTVTAGRTL